MGEQIELKTKLFKLDGTGAGGLKKLNEFLDNAPNAGVESIPVMEGVYIKVTYQERKENE